MEKVNTEHTFVICAYKESPYLEDCIKSLQKQTIKSEIIISTSTPNNLIKSLAKKYNIKLIVNSERKGHVADFCFAYKQAHTKYITLAHQDDVYDRKFTELTLRKMSKVKKPIVAFTNYYELRKQQIVKWNNLLNIKRLINFPIKVFKKSRKVRLFLLSLGNAICAPTITYNKELVKYPIKNSNMKADIDWDTWIDLAKKDGSFIYISRPLLLRRIHEQSLTSSVVENDIRKAEDFEMFKRFWPVKIAKALTKVYSKSERSNKLQEKRKVKKMEILIIAIYLVLTVAGLILFKYGANQNFLVSINNKSLECKINLFSILGLICYLCSFVIYIIILSKFNISYIIPIVSAISYISIFILSILILKEKVHLNGIIGAFVILIGIIIMNIGGHK